MKYFIDDWDSDCFILWDYIKDINFIDNKRRKCINSQKGKTLSILYGLTHAPMLKQGQWRTKDPNSCRFFTKARMEFPHIQDILEEFSSLYFPKNFKWNSVTMNKNLKCKAHYDKTNVGDSILIGLGDYTKGELKIEDKIYNTWNEKIIFNGATQKHETMDWVGNRYTLIFFYTKKYSTGNL